MEELASSDDLGPGSTDLDAGDHIPGKCCGFTGVLSAQGRDAERPQLLQGRGRLSQGCSDLREVAYLRGLRSHSVHAPGRQNCVDVFKEQAVVKERGDGLVLLAPLDGALVEVQARTGERLAASPE
jgi:hypothetical protein